MTTHTNSANTRRAPPMPAILPPPQKKAKNEKTSQWKTPQLHHATKSTMQTLTRSGRKIEVETGFGVEDEEQEDHDHDTKTLKP